MKKLVFTVTILTLSICTAVQANYSGSLATSNGGLIGTGVWASGPSVLGWEVELNGNTWHYEYTLTVPQGGVSHLIIETSPSFTSSDIWNATVGFDIGDWGQQGNSNPGIPESVYGIKFGGGGTDYSVSFDSDRAPVWGDFYSKDGTAGNPQGSGIVNALWNEGFTASDPTEDPANGTIRNHILRPDTTTTTTIPAPGAILLGSLGMGIVGWLRRRRAL